MKMTNDDLLNKYIDGELTGEEKLNFEKMISESSLLRARLETMRNLEKTLRRMEPESPSEMFTAKVMNRLKKKVSYSRSQNNFIIAVAGFIVLLCLVISGYFIAMVINSVGVNSSAAAFSDQLSNGINDSVNILKGLFNPEFFSYIGSLISMIVLISGYFFFETQRRALKK